jgi:hypothetical protein
VIVRAIPFFNRQSFWIKSLHINSEQIMRKARRFSFKWDLRSWLSKVLASNWKTWCDFSIQWKPHRFVTVDIIRDQSGRKTI